MLERVLVVGDSTATAYAIDVANKAMHGCASSDASRQMSDEAASNRP